MKPVLIFSHVECEPLGYLVKILQRLNYPHQQLYLLEDINITTNLDNCAGLVFLGGAGDVNQPTEWMQKEIEIIKLADVMEIPILGICLGAQLMSKAFGGDVWLSPQMEVGWHEVQLLPSQQKHPWLKNIDERFMAFHWHAHEFSPPAGAISIAGSTCTECQGFIYKRHLAIQFHLEMTEVIILELLERYADDLDDPSNCVQQIEEIKQDLSTRCKQAFSIADVLFKRWFKALYEE
jgi:GMP synthase-like glutamine amidotransferase